MIFIMLKTFLFPLGRLPGVIAILAAMLLTGCVSNHGSSVPFGVSVMDFGAKGDGAHHHTWPFAGIINFDEVVQGLIDVGYKGFFNFEASYSLIHHLNLPYHRKPWEREGEVVTKLLDPSVALKQKATDLLYECGKYILETYGLYEE